MQRERLDYLYRHVVKPECLENLKNQIAVMQAIDDVNRYYFIEMMSSGITRQ